MRPITSGARVVALLFTCLPCAYCLNDLCLGQEGPIFAVPPANKKIVSVCASADASKTSGYVVYRFGSTDGRVELQVPRDPRQFRDIMTAAELVFDDKNEDDWLLRFRNGRTSYVVYGGAGSTWNIHGVAIFKGEKLIRKRACDGHPTAFGLPRNDQVHLGIPFEDDAKARRIWDQLRPK